MSRGHSASRRRHYGRRQTEVRQRRTPDPMLDADEPTSWPRGAAWEPATDTTAPWIGAPEPHSSTDGLPPAAGTSR